MCTQRPSSVFNVLEISVDSFPKGNKVARMAILFFEMLIQGTPSKISTLTLWPLLSAHVKALKTLKRTGERLGFFPYSMKTFLSLCNFLQTAENSFFFSRPILNIKPKILKQPITEIKYQRRKSLKSDRTIINSDFLITRELPISAGHHEDLYLANSPQRY